MNISPVNQSVQANQINFSSRHITPKNAQALLGDMGKSYIELMPDEMAQKFSECLNLADSCLHKASKEKNFIKKWLLGRMAKGYQKEADKILEQTKINANKKIGL